MKTKTLFYSLLIVVSLIVSLHLSAIFGQVLAQEQSEEIVYFIDGTSARGKIIHINRQIIQIRDNEGRIIERSTKQIYKFSTKRQFSEIFRKALEEENRKF